MQNMTFSVALAQQWDITPSVDVSVSDRKKYTLNLALVSRSKLAKTNALVKWSNMDFWLSGIHLAQCIRAVSFAVIILL